jgi:WD40 repeat protein
MSKLIPITTPLREFKGHELSISAVSVFPDKLRMITGSYDRTLRLWDLDTGAVLKIMEGHRSLVVRLRVSRDGQFIASGDRDGEVIIWQGETGESLIQLTKAHSGGITSLDFSPDGTVLTTSSWDKTMKLWPTKTWERQGNPIKCGSDILCIRYSPFGELLAIATNSIEIYDSSTRERVVSFKGHTSHNFSLAWTPDGTRLLTGGDNFDPTIREWDTATWQQVGDPWTGHSDYINAIAINPAGTLVASTSRETHVYLWRLSDRRTVAIFKHSFPPECVTFSVDGKHILSGGDDKMISELAIPNDIHSKARFRP